MKKRFIILPTVTFAAVIAVISVSLAGCPHDESMMQARVANFSTDSTELGNVIKSEMQSEIPVTAPVSETRQIVADVYIKETKPVIQKEKTPEEKLSDISYTYSEDNYLYTIVAADGFDSYKWIIDGVELTKYDDRVYSLDNNVLKILPCAGYNFETEEFSWKIEDSTISLVAVKGDDVYRVDF